MKRKPQTPGSYSAATLQWSTNDVRKFAIKGLSGESGADQQTFSGRH